MRMMVFGATGRTGLPLVRQAIAADHSVIVFVRDAARLPNDVREHVTVFEGDVMNPRDVRSAFEKSEVDAVVSVLGPAKGSPDDLMPKAADAILSGMSAHGVSRLVWMTGAGVPGDGDKPKLMNHVIKGLLTIISGKVLKQSENAAEAIRESGLEWTIVRVPMLVDGEASGAYRVGRVGVGTGAKLIRADGASYILRVLEENKEVGKSPVVSN